MERHRKIVKVTRRGQTTIPIEFRKRHRIEEGSRLVVEDRGDSIVFRPVARLEDLGGSLSKTTTLERMLKILDESREDEDCRRSWIQGSSSPTTPREGEGLLTTWICGPPIRIRGTLRFRCLNLGYSALGAT